MPNGQEVPRILGPQQRKILPTRKVRPRVEVRVPPAVRPPAAPARAREQVIAEEERRLEAMRRQAELVVGAREYREQWAIRQAFDARIAAIEMLTSHVALARNQSMIETLRAQLWEENVAAHRDVQALIDAQALMPLLRWAFGTPQEWLRLLRERISAFHEAATTRDNRMKFEVTAERARMPRAKLLSLWRAGMLPLQVGFQIFPAPPDGRVLLLPPDRAGRARIAQDILELIAELVPQLRDRIMGVKGLVQRFRDAQVAPTTYLDPSLIEESKPEIRALLLEAAGPAGNEAVARIDELIRTDGLLNLLLLSDEQLLDSGVQDPAALREVIEREFFSLLGKLSAINAEARDLAGRINVGITTFAPRYREDRVFRRDVNETLRRIGGALARERRAAMEEAVNRLQEILARWDPSLPRGMVRTVRDWQASISAFLPEEYSRRLGELLNRGSRIAPYDTYELISALNEINMELDGLEIDQAVTNILWQMFNIGFATIGPGAAVLSLAFTLWLDDGTLDTADIRELVRLAAEVIHGTTADRIHRLLTDALPKSRDPAVTNMIMTALENLDRIGPQAMRIFRPLVERHERFTVANPNVPIEVLVAYLLAVPDPPPSEGAFPMSIVDRQGNIILYDQNLRILTAGEMRRVLDLVDSMTEEYATLTREAPAWFWYARTLGVFPLDPEQEVRALSEPLPKDVDPSAFEVGLPGVDTAEFMSWPHEVARARMDELAAANPEAFREWTRMREEGERIAQKQEEILEILRRTGFDHNADLHRALLATLAGSWLTLAEWLSLGREDLQRAVEEGLVSEADVNAGIAELMNAIEAWTEDLRTYVVMAGTPEGLGILVRIGLATVNVPPEDRDWIAADPLAERTGGPIEAHVFGAFDAAMMAIMVPGILRASSRSIPAFRYLSLVSGRQSRQIDLMMRISREAGAAMTPEARAAVATMTTTERKWAAWSLSAALRGGFLEPAATVEAILRASLVLDRGTFYSVLLWGYRGRNMALWARGIPVWFRRAFSWLSPFLRLFQFDERLIAPGLQRLGERTQVAWRTPGVQQAIRRAFSREVAEGWYGVIRRSVNPQAVAGRLQLLER